MALAKFSALVSGIYGKLNGSVFSNTRAGIALKNKVTPTNPQSTAQQSVRSKFAYYAASWRTLSDAQRQSWKNAAALHTRFNHWGDPYTMTGFSLFMSCRQNLSLLGMPNAATMNWYTTPPMPTLPYGLSVVYDTQAVNKIVLSWTPAPNDQNVEFLIYATPALSAGVNYVSSQFRLIHVYKQPGLFPVYMDNSYFTRFTIGTPGQRVFFKIIPISKRSGDGYQPVINSTTIL